MFTTVQLDAELVLTTTRAVRRRFDLDKPVDLSVVERCLAIALQAPNGGNRQAWRWMVVTDQRLRTGIAEIYRRVSDQPFRAASASAETESSRRAYDSAQYLASILDQIPVFVIPCALGRPDGAVGTRSAAGLFGSIIPAVWSLQLALRLYGLGSCYTTAHLRAESEVAQLLGIPGDVSQIALLPIGHVRGTTFRPGLRKPVTEVAFLNAWDRHWSVG